MDINELRKSADDSTYQLGDKVLTKDQAIDHLKAQNLEVQKSIVRQRDEWVQHRAQNGVEERWRKANALYHGEETPDTSFVETLKSGPSAKRSATPEANRSRVVVNIVRPKVDQAIARMCEILLPVDDRNWGIKATPVPENVKAMLGDMRPTVDPETGQPTGLTADREAQHVTKHARDSANAMQDAIDDVLTECHYNAEQRDGISDGVRLGTMVILGPYPTRQTSKVWDNTGGKSRMVVTDKIVFGSCHSDPWDVWFDPAAGKNHQRGAGFWHRKLATKKELRQLVGLPGYDADAIRTILNNPPTRVRVAEGRVTKYAAKEQAYELWTYHGDIEPDDMASASMNTGDPLADVEFGVVMLVNDVVIGAIPSWIPDKSLPVDVWNWRESDDSPYGFGLPHEMDHQQRVVTSAWRRVMDNASSSIGSQIVFMGGVAPVNGSMEATPNKFWKVDPTKIDDVTKAFHIFDFPSHLQDLLAIAKTAMELADSETSMPQMLGGSEAGGGGGPAETLGGMVIKYNNANAVLRMRVKLYDDNITVPHIGRHYDLQMMTNPDSKVKGDNEVDARGSTSLLEKDIQNQATVNLANVTSNPRYQPYLDAKEELKMILKAFKVQPDSVMATDEQIKKNLSQPTQPDPRIVSAQMTLEAKKLDVQDAQQQRQVDMERQQADISIRTETMEYNKQREQGEYTIAMTHEQNVRDLAQQKMAHEERTTAAEIEAETGIKHLEIDTERQLFNAEAALRVQTGEGI